MTLAFETGDSVDDIGCGLADGTTLRLQAKRACGADAQLTASVSQWAGQVSHLRPSDRMGLATAEPRGPVRNLGAALDRHRRPVPGQYTSDERRALDAVRERLPEGTAEDIIEQILDAATVIRVAASVPSDEGFRSVANLLDGVVVSRGRGSAAIGALQRAFQQQATTGTGSDLDEWLRILEQAGIQVIPDAEGAAGQQRQSELHAIAAHSARLAARDGILEFSLDLTTIASEASAAIQAWSDGDRDVVEVFFAPPPSTSPELEPTRLDSGDIDCLIKALGATSDWIAHAAFRVLLNARDPAVGERTRELIPSLPVGRRYKATILAVTNDLNPPEAAASMLDSGDPATRAGGAAAARLYAAASNPTRWKSLLDRAQADSDMTVQSAAGLDRAAQTATCWTCLKCGTANETTVRWCASCNKPTFPSKYPDIVDSRPLTAVCGTLPG